MTRTPIVLQLKHVEDTAAQYAEISYDAGGKEGIVVKQLADFEDVAPEIQAATAKLAGTSLVPKSE